MEMASHYPEAIPLQRHTAEDVAEVEARSCFKNSFIKGYLVELSKFLLTGMEKPSLV